MRASSETVPPDGPGTPTAPPPTAPPPTAPSPTEAPPTSRAGISGWLSVLAVTFGIFAVVTAEQLPVGLLTSIGGELGVSEGVVGLLVTAPGLVAAVAAPVVPLLAGALNRRWLLGGLLAVLATAHVAAAVTPNFAVLLASRVLVGLAIGGFWAIAGGLAVRLVPAPSVPRATALIFGGVAAANVLGIPLGTLVGELTQWRVAFAILAGFGLVVLAAIPLVLPALPADEPVRAGVLVRQLHDPVVRRVVLATFLVVTGHFAAYTFVGPVLGQESGIGAGAVGTLLLGYGLSGLVGNVVAGSTATARPRTTVAVIAGAIAAVLALFPLVGGSPAAGIVLLVLWGLSFGGVSVSLQNWILAAAPRAREAASSLWVATFNLSIAAGALLGGRLIDGASTTLVLVVAALLVALTVPVVVTRPARTGR